MKDEIYERVTDRREFPVEDCNDSGLCRAKNLKSILREPMNQRELNATLYQMRGMRSLPPRLGLLCVFHNWEVNLDEPRKLIKLMPPFHCRIDE